MIKLYSIIIFSGIIISVFGQNRIYIDDINLQNSTSGWKMPQKNKAIDGSKLSIDSVEYSHGVGVHAYSLIVLDLENKVDSISGLCGMDDAQINNKYVNPVEFYLIADGDTIWRSKTIYPGEGAKSFNLNLENYRILAMKVETMGWETGGTFANWVDVVFHTSLDQIQNIKEYSGYFTRDESDINESDHDFKNIIYDSKVSKPRINTPDLYGCTPGKHFHYYIPVVGEGPLNFKIKGLPDSLKFNEEKQLITGVVKDSGDYNIIISVSNDYGKTEKSLLIRAKGKIVLTPPLGWNSWNCFGPRVTQDKILKTASIIKNSGLADHGYTYVTIDDGWQGERGGKYNGLQGNERFPDVGELCDSIHGMGLKPGIYSTPWATSYMRMNGGSADDTLGNVFFKRRSFGVYPFHEQDAKQFADWGIDYLKYDWANPDIAYAKAMSDALRSTNRDIVFSISGAISVLDADEFSKVSNLYRVNGDIEDTWESVFKRGFEHQRWNKFTFPGHYADPDMMVVGHVGKGKGIHPSKLTADEQYTHFSLWAMFSAPIILGNDLTKLDTFTYNLITNDEVLEIHQDTLVSPAELAKKDNSGGYIYKKKLGNGDIVIGFFNTSEDLRRLDINFSEIGLEEDKKYLLRDLWLHKDIKDVENFYEAVVRPNGVVLIRVYR